MLEFGWHPSPLVVAEDLAQAAILLHDFEIPLQLSIDPASKALERRFDNEGPGWAPWAESYAPFAEAYPNVGILWQSGDLVGSVVDEGNYDVGITTLEWTGAESPFYWEFHQMGTRKMPARPFVGLDEVAIAEITVIFDEYLGVVADVAAGHSFEPKGRGSRIRGAGGRFVKPGSVL